MKHCNLMVTFFLMVIFSMQSEAQIGIFLKIEGIDGESVSKEHKDWILLSEFGQGIVLNNPTATGRVAVGKANFSAMEVAKKIDKSSPLLMLKCATGEVIPRLEINMTGADGKAFYKVILTEVLISSIKSGSSSPSLDEMIEEVSFTYSKITWEYIDKSGKKYISGYDVKANKKV